MRGKGSSWDEFQWNESKEEESMLHSKRAGRNWSAENVMDAPVGGYV